MGNLLMIGITGCTCLVTRLGVLLVRFVAVVVDVVDARAVDGLGFAVPLSVAVAPVALCVGAGRLKIFDVGLTRLISCSRTCA